MNGTFTLAQVLQATATSAGGTGSAFAPVGGSANPTTLLTYTAPKSNDAVTINFKQSIGRTEAPAYRPVQQDPDVHAVDHDSVSVTRPSPGARSRAPG